MHIPVPTCAKPHFLSKAYAWNAILEITGMKAELPVSNKNICDMGKLREIIIYTFDPYHHLVAIIYGKRHILDTLGSHVYLWQLTYLSEYRVVTGSGLAFGWDHLYLRVEAGKEGGYQIVESIEDTQHDDKSRRSDDNANNRYYGDDVDGMSALLGEKIPAGYE